MHVYYCVLRSPMTSSDAETDFEPIIIILLCILLFINQLPRMIWRYMSVGESENEFWVIGRYHVQTCCLLSVHEIANSNVA